MELSTSLACHGTIVIYTVEGDFDPDAILAAARARYTNPKFARVAVYLWDIRRIAIPESPDLRDSTRNVAEIRASRKDARPVIVVVDRLGSVQYGMARMWQNTFDFPMEIFENFEQAMSMAERLANNS